MFRQRNKHRRTKRDLFGASMVVIGLLLVGGLTGCDLFTDGLGPPAPTGVRATEDQLPERVRVTWDAVPEAAGYEVYRAGQADGEYQFVGHSSSPSFDDMSVTPGTRYWYRVRSCSRSGCSEFSDETSGRAAVAALDAPVGVSASEGDYEDEIRVSWQAVDQADEYSVYRAPEEDGPYTMIVEVGATSYVDEDVEPEETYWYKVRACSDEGCSKLSRAASGYAAVGIPAVPADVTAEGDEELGAIVITWNESAGATEYEVYRAEEEDAEFEQIGETTTTSYEDATGEPGETYWFRVSACSEAGCSELSQTASATFPEDEDVPPPPPGD